MTALRELLVAAACAMAVPALAQGLTDPMRPPEVAAAGPGAAARGGPVLQTVIIAGPKRLAVIDGQTVEVGGRIGEARVVRIAESEVTLRDDAGTSVLRLYPAVDKKLKAPAKVAAKEANTK